jgi:uncharacterized protein (TIGR02453 family)
MTGEPFDTARALRWLRQLKKNNDRAWFAAHRETYDAYVKPEWEDLVAALLVSAVRFDERFAYVDPRRCLFRLARDIRFRADKTPFKTGVQAWLSPFGKSGAYAGFYMRISPGDSIFSAGIYTPEKPVLEALRRRMAADPRPFDRILRAKALVPYLPLRTDGLVRMPRGFPKEHPRGELIRARNYLVRRAYSDAEITRRGAFAVFRAAIRDCAPLVRYIDGVAATALGPAQDRLSSAAMREPSEGWDENSTSDHFGPSSSARF